MRCSRVAAASNDFFPPRIPGRRRQRLPIVAAAVSLLLLLSAHIQPAAATCYYPDGSTANDVPCSSDTDESACCGTGYACFGVSSQYYLCKSTGDEIQKADASTFVRGSCTDQSWRSGNCPSVCVDPDRDDVSGGNGVGQCPGSETEYYCISSGLGVANCSTGFDLIDFAATPTALTTIGVLPSSTSSSSSTSSTTASSSTTTTSTSPTGTGAAITNSPTNTGSSSGLSDGAKAGIGVGVSLGVVGAAAVIGYFVWRARNNKKRHAAELAAAGMTPNGGGNGGMAMANAPAGYGPVPTGAAYYPAAPPNSTSPHPPSELYYAGGAYGGNKDAVTSSSSGSPGLYGSPDQQQQPPSAPAEMPANAYRYEMA